MKLKFNKEKDHLDCLLKSKNRNNLTLVTNDQFDDNYSDAGYHDIARLKNIIRKKKQLGEKTLKAVQHINKVYQDTVFKVVPKDPKKEKYGRNLKIQPHVQPHDNINKSKESTTK